MDPLHLLRSTKTPHPASFELEIHPSLAIPEIERRLSERQEKVNILDLGKAFGSNLDFYTRFADLIHFDDLLESQKSDAKEALDFSRVLRFPEGFRFDVILCWDILNYLRPAQREALGKALVTLSGKDTLLFTLICNAPVMPRTPSCIRVSRGNKLCYEFSERTLAPVVSSERVHIESDFKGFRRLRAFRLRNGFEEHLYQWSSGS